MNVLTLNWKGTAMNLRQLLGFKPIEKTYDEHEHMARNLIRQLTLLGFDAYDVWCVSEHMLKYSLDAPNNSDLFPTNQRPVHLRQHSE